MQNGADVSLRDVTIAQMGNRAREHEWCHAPEVRRGFWEFWRKSVELRTGHWTRRVDFRSSLRQDEFACYGCRTRWGGGRWKSQNRKNVYLSPYVEEPLNSKVIKSFVPELRSRKGFLCFKIPMFYVYMLWTFYVHFPYSCMGMVHMEIEMGRKITVWIFQATNWWVAHGKV